MCASPFGSHTWRHLRTLLGSSGWEFLNAYETSMPCLMDSKCACSHELRSQSLWKLHGLPPECSWLFFSPKSINLKQKSAAGGDATCFHGHRKAVSITALKELLCTSTWERGSCRGSRTELLPWFIQSQGHSQSPAPARPLSALTQPFLPGCPLFPCFYPAEVMGELCTGLNILWILSTRSKITVIVLLIHSSSCFWFKWLP